MNSYPVSPKRALQTAAALLLGAMATAPWVAQAQNKAPAVNISDGVVKMGLLLDMSSLYEEVTGMGTVTAVKMAIEDFGGKVHGMPIEVLYADHQNKADLAGSKAREWFDAQKVDMIGDVAASVYCYLDDLSGWLKRRLGGASAPSQDPTLKM